MGGLRTQSVRVGWDRGRDGRGTAIPNADLKAITRIARICSEGIDASDDIVWILLSLFNGLGQLLRPKLSLSMEWMEADGYTSRPGGVVLHERHEQHALHRALPGHSLPPRAGMKRGTSARDATVLKSCSPLQFGSWRVEACVHGGMLRMPLMPLM